MRIRSRRFLLETAERRIGLLWRLPPARVAAERLDGSGNTI
jgi:hypothetical protein